MGSASDREQAPEMLGHRRRAGSAQARRNWPLRQFRRLMAVAVCLLPVSQSIPMSTWHAEALSNGNGITKAKGFDDCSLPSPAAMSTWWTYSPYFWYAMYIGGSNTPCPGPSASWLNTVRGQGWNFEFIWFGLQPPGTGYAHTFSTIPATAFTQGENEAVSAVIALKNDGVTNDAQSTPIVFDLDSGNSKYQSAVNSFIEGWVTYMHQCCATQLAGVYGSVCGSNLQPLASITPVPDFIWGAWYNGIPSTKNLWTGSCGVPSGAWTSNQRLKQYTNTHQEFWPTSHGTPLNIDNDCADGPTAPGGFGSDASCTS